MNLFRREEEAEDPARPYRALIELIETTSRVARIASGASRRDAAQLWCAGLRAVGGRRAYEARARERQAACPGRERRPAMGLLAAPRAVAVSGRGLRISYRGEHERRPTRSRSLSLVEAILEDPRAILYGRSSNRIKAELIATS